MRTLIDECSQEKEMLDMVTTEMDQAMHEERRLHNLLLKSLLPKDDADERDCILEVRAGIKRLPNKFLFHCMSFIFLFFCMTKDFIRNWWRRGFFVCNGHI